MQNNNNYSNSLDPELHGSVDFDFFGNDDENEAGNKENLSTIEEVDVISRNSGDNSLKSGSIGELGGNRREAGNNLNHNSRSQTSMKSSVDSSSSSSSSSESDASSPTRASTKSASTVRSGGFPPMPRGDSTRPQSPTPPSSHESPSPHRVASAPRSVSPPGAGSARSASPSGNRSPTPTMSSERSLSSARSRSSNSHSRSPRGSQHNASNPSSRSSSTSPPASTSRLSVSPPPIEKHDRSPSISPSPSSSSSPSRSNSPVSNRSREKNRSERAHRHRRSSASSVSSSESDVTDVSPLSSKQQSPLGSPPPARKPPPTAPGQARQHKERVRYHARGRTEPNGEGDADQMNVELIMRAILELDRERQGAQQPLSRRSNRPNSAKVGAGSTEKNYSFTSERCMQIEAENQRLLEQLLGQESRRRRRGAFAGSRPTTASSGGGVGGVMPAQRPYHSTINRIREQRRIEEENRNILRRLSKVRPTPSMTRDQQLRDYQRQSTYGAFPLSACRPRRSAPAVAPGPLEDRAPLRRTQSNEQIPPARGSAGGRGRGRNRPASAKIGGQSHKDVRATSSRPEWPSGW